MGEVVFNPNNGELQEIASKGPFSQIQMCDCLQESLTKLMAQLLKKIPLGKPYSKEAHINQYVSDFIQNI